MTEINPQTPIPQEFSKEAVDAAGKYDYSADRFFTSKGMGFIAGAEWAYRALSPSAAPSAGMRYTIPVKICNSCGGPVSNDPFERVIHEEGAYEYYFCKKCCDQNKHFKISISK